MDRHPVQVRKPGQQDPPDLEIMGGVYIMFGGLTAHGGKVAEAVGSGDTKPERWVPADAASYTTLHWDFEKTFREAADLFGCTAPFGAVAGQGSLVLHVSKDRIWHLTDWLRARGATTMTISELAYVLDGSVDAHASVFEALGLS